MLIIASAEHKENTTTNSGHESLDQSGNLSSSSSGSIVDDVDTASNDDAAGNTTGGEETEAIVRLTKKVSQLEAHLQYQSSVQCSFGMKIWNLERRQEQCEKLRIQEPRERTVELNQQQHLIETECNNSPVSNETQLELKAQQSNPELEQQLKSCKSQIQSLEARLKNATDECKKLKQQQQISLVEQDAQQKKFSEMQAQLARQKQSFEDRLRNAEEERDKLTATVAQTLINIKRPLENGNLEKHMKTCSSQIQSLEARLKNSTDECKKLKQQVQSKSQQNIAANKKQWQSEKESLENRLRNAENERDKVKSAMSVDLGIMAKKLTKSVQYFEGQQKEWLDTKKSLEKSVTISKAECMQLRAKFKAIEDKGHMVSDEEFISIAETSLKKLDLKCSNKSCDRTSAARIRCPNHEKCTNQCRQAIDGLSVLLHEENGLLYCENCIAFTCEHCNCRLTGDCVIYKKKVLHEYCHVVSF